MESINYLIILLLVLVVYVIYKTYQSDKLEIIQLVLFAITLITAYFSYYDRIVKEQQLMSEITQNLTIGVYDRLRDNYPYSHQLYVSMHSNLPGRETINHVEVDDKNKEETVEFSLSVEIIDTIADFYSIEDKLSKDVYDSWILTFRVWFKSKILLKVWSHIKSTYREKIVEFVDKVLIDY